MKIYKISENRINFFVIYLVMVVLLIVGRDTLITNEVIGFVNSQIITIVLLGVLGVTFLVKNRRKLREIVFDRRVGIIIIAAVIYLLPMIIKLDLQLMYLSILLCVVFGVFASYILSINQAAKVYVLTMCVLALYSFVTVYIFKPLTVSGLLPASIITNDAGLTYYNYGLAFSVTLPTYMRNMSIFREPGVFNFFLILAIYLNSDHVKYSKKYISYAITLILSVGVISTFSTAGIIELVLLLVFFAVDRQIYKHKLFWVAIGVGMVTILILGSMVAAEKGDLYWELYSMFSKLFTANESLAARTASVWGNLNMFFNHFLLGDTVVNVKYSLGDNTASSLILFAMCGVLGGLANVVGWCVLLYRSSRSIFMNAWLIIVMFMTFNTQDLTTNLYFWLFPIMALCRFVHSISGKAHQKKAKEE